MMEDNALDVMVIRVGEPDWCAYTVPFIAHYCRVNGYRLHWVDRWPDSVPRDRHPSWLKLLGFRLLFGRVGFGSTFLLCWDLDLIPLPGARPIHPFLDLDRFNVCRQGTGPRMRRFLARHNPLSIPPGGPHYNCGLFGFPWYLSGVLESMYHRSLSVAPESQTFYEQLHINRAILDNTLPVHEVSESFNHIAGRKLLESDAGPASPYDCIHLAGHPRRRLTRATAVWQARRHELKA